MASELRKTGISVIADAPWGTHFCHFYETQQDLLDTLVPYFKAGLESNEFCLWVVSNSDLITVEKAKAALAQAVPDLDRHLSDESIEILNGLGWYLEENVFSLDRVTKGWDAKLKRALARGYEGMRVSGDTLWLATKDWKDFYAYEKQLNDSIAGRHMSLLCTYSLAKSGAAEVLDVVQAHQFAVARRQGEWEIIETPELIQAKAEIKRVYEELEQRVVERTNELRVANQELRKEIAERERAEALLHVQGQVFRAIVENAPDQIIRYDREFRRTYVNPAVAQFYGRPAETLIGKPFGSGVPEAGLEVKEYELAQVRQSIASVFNTGKSYEYEMTWTMPTGRTCFSIRLFPELDLNGSVVNVLGISRDITARKLAEEGLSKEKEILKKVFDNIPVMIGFVGDDGRVKLVNPEWERTIGWTLKELREQNVDIFAESYPDLSYRQEVLDFIAASTGEWVDLNIKVRDGRVIDAACAVVHLSDGTRVAIAQDITERKRAEERVRETTEQLRALSASLQSAREEEGTRIARQIHDELGGALTSLKWDLESFEKVVAESSDRSQLQVLQERIQTMLRTSETMIGAVRRISSELRPSVLDDLGLTAAIEWQAREFQARTKIICHCDCPIEVDLNPEKSTAIFRILQEALTNILRHAQATKVDIVMKQEAGEFVLAVGDNGKGITEDDKSRLQSLGLLGMRERAHLIGGEIDIIGLEEQGTLVTVRVPL